ncbi:MAG: NADH:ubiquinone oxidoreductase subunit NDUFA12 [Alphaproteobacteria bacterium]|jgi:NADH:ubiquinone oxidoreductase subunit|nr:NADH:ubiquinone oxidoreductase subunit NDUFA12 [Alphaproteobacteria bacterium]
MSLSIYFRTWWRGRFVGEDIQGNKYFEGKKMMRYGKLRRWVIYKGRVEASKVPAEWHGWLHYTNDEPPESRHPYPWEKAHLPNLTGTKYAHQPKGLRGIEPEKDYVAWEPK